VRIGDCESNDTTGSSEPGKLVDALGACGLLGGGAALLKNAQRTPCESWRAMPEQDGDDHSPRPFTNFNATPGTLWRANSGTITLMCPVLHNP